MSDVSWTDPTDFKVKAIIFDTAVILFNGDQVEGPVLGESPLKALMAQVLTQEAARDYLKHILDDVPAEVLPRYNLRVEDILRARWQEDNYHGKV